MSDDSPGGEPGGRVVRYGTGPAGGAELPSLALLAVAADPALAQQIGAGQPDPYSTEVSSGRQTATSTTGTSHSFDPGFLSGMDSTLDLLTTSTDLFDVPAMDVDGTWNDGTSA